MVKNLIDELEIAMASNGAKHSQASAYFHRSPHCAGNYPLVSILVQWSRKMFDNGGKGGQFFR